MRRVTSMALVEAISYRRETTTLVRVATWAASEATVDFCQGEGGAVEYSDSHWQSSGGAAEVVAQRCL